MLAFVIVAVALSLIMAGAWLIQRRTGQSGWIDTIWSIASGAAGAALALYNGDAEHPARTLLVAALALAWGLRLGLYIGWRTWGGGEDPRYADLARQWGASFPSRLFWFLQIQAVCAFVLAICVYVAARNPAPFPGIGDVLGVLTFAVALAGESIADRQLAAFRANPANRGRVCDVGLWGWSRHPNYFFEWLIWIAFALFALNASGAWNWGFLALLGPIQMYWLLAHASGVPPLEAHMLKTRGAAFADYQARVNAFFPAPPRKLGIVTRSEAP